METTRALGIIGPLTLKNIMGWSNKQNGLRCNETVLQALRMFYTGTKPKSILTTKQRTTLDQLAI